MTKRRQRILFLTTSYPRIGDDAAGHFVRSEVERLREKGHSVVVAAPGGPFEDPEVLALGADRLFASPGALPRLRQNPLRFWGLVPATVRVLRLVSRENRFDRVICHWLLPTAFPWGLLVRDPATTLCAVAHGSDVRMLLRMPGPLRERILKWLLGARFELRFVSDELREALAASALSPQVRRFVQDALVQPSPIECLGTPRKNEARVSLGLNEGDRWAVVVGRLLETKRPHVALAAATLVPNLNVAVIGNGPLLERLKEAYPSAKFLGHLPRNQTLCWISAADVLVSASRFEGAPTTIREARTLGTLVVSSSCGDLDDWAKSDVDLWLVDRGQASESRGNN